MFEGKSFIDILSIGGFTLYVLLFASCLSIAVILLKIFEFWKKKIDMESFFAQLKNKLETLTLDDTISFCKKQNKPIANVVKEGLVCYKNTNSLEIKSSIDRAISIETMNLERYIPILATIGGIAVYIGLFGTVLGIIRSFHDMSVAGSGGISVVIGGVSESLIATAAGLSVAIPAVIAYNFFVRSIEKFGIEMEYAGSLLKELLLSITKK